MGTFGVSLGKRPEGSTWTMAFTRFGRSRAVTVAKMAPSPFEMRMAGPMSSRRIAPRVRHTFCVMALLAMGWPNDAVIWTTSGSVADLPTACGGLFEGLGFAVELAVDEGLVGIASLAGAVDDVDLVALFEQERGPAAAAVGRAVPVAALAVASVDEHDGIRVAHYGGDPVFDEHLHAVADGAAGEQGVFDAVEAEGPFGDVEDGAREWWRFVQRSGPAELRTHLWRRLRIHFVLFPWPVPHSKILYRYGVVSVIGSRRL